MFIHEVFIASFSGIPCPPEKKTDDPQGRCCVFPFTYMGKSYNVCTSVDHHRPWCSFDAVYSEQWANCGKKKQLRCNEKTAFINVMSYLAF